MKTLLVCLFIMLGFKFHFPKSNIATKQQVTPIVKDQKNFTKLEVEFNSLSSIEGFINTVVFTKCIMMGLN